MADELKAIDQIRIHQALHGYSEGHRLLASSIKLQSKDEKTMLILSDASGTGSISTEEGYLTGYPLPESGYYALARTWTAPEIPRPGCVWTHTLLIDFSDLALLPNLQILATAFRRHSVHLSISDYSNPLILPTQADLTDIADIALARQLLVALYEKPKERIVSFIGSLPSREDAVFKIWSQQWPKLRRSFRFCTLSITDRTIEGGSFDLQFAPSGERAAKARFKSAVDADSTEPDTIDWLKDALQDIVDGENGKLREFLRQVGSEVAHGREAFISLCRLYRLVRESELHPEALEHAIEILEQSFGKDTARSARLLILTRAANQVENLGSQGLSFVMSNLNLIHPSDFETLTRRIGKALWSSDTDQVLKLLGMDSQHRIIGEQTLAALPLKELLVGIKNKPENVATIIQHRPEILTEPSFWTCDNASQWISSDVLVNAKISTEDVITAIIKSQQSYFANKVATTFGHYNVLLSVSKIIDQKHSENLSLVETTWLKEAISNAGSVAEVLSEKTIKSLPTLNIIAYQTHPDFVPNDYGEDPWWTSISQFKPNSSSGSLYYLAAYLLARALGYRSHSQAELISWTLDTLYQPALTSQISNEIWSLIEPRLSWYFFVHYWDRCQRLRLTIVDTFISRKLSPLIFGTITEDNNLFLELVDIAARSGRGRHYLEQVLHALRTSSLQNFSHRAMTIQKYLK